MQRGKKFDELLNDKRFVRVATILGIAVILLIFLSTFIDFSPDSSALSDEYAKRTQKELLEILSKIDGVGDVEVFLTMDDGGENVYMKNSDTKTVSIEPKVRGVVVVCEGGDDPIVVSRVLEAVTKSLDLHADKVCITK